MGRREWVVRLITQIPPRFSQAKEVSLTALSKSPQNSRKSVGVLRKRIFLAERGINTDTNVCIKVKDNKKKEKTSKKSANILY